MDSTEEFGAAAGHQDPRRTLLVVYIHGFMGNDTSFQRFPAHMHEFLRESLTETHAVHTKIYPRYKTYRTIDVATENFSRWLSPHEGPTTDVVLVGHSMGGLLAADVVLLSAPGVQGGRRRHRILGTVSLDSPFLGLHPGIITAGIASLFRKSPEPPGKDAWAEADQRGRLGAAPSTPNFPALSPSSSLSPEPSLYGDLSELSPAPSAASSSTGASYFQSNASQGTVGSSKQNAQQPSALDSIISIGRSATAVGKSDPHYNPPFFNDVQFKDRGFLRNVWHFAQKRKLEGENLIDAATDHIVRHLQFGKCLADLKGLHARYDAIRELEDEGMETRVRFVNYYTASTGRPKEPKEPKDGSKSPFRRSHSREDSTTSLGTNGATTDAATGAVTTTGGLLDAPDRASDSSQLTTPRISIEHHGDSSDPNASGIAGSSTGKAQEAGPSREANGFPGLNIDMPHERADPETPPPEYESGTNTPELRSISPNPEEEAPPPLPQRPTSNTAGEMFSDKPEDDSTIPPAPQEPERLNIPEDATPEERKRLDKEHKQALKKYEQDVKARIKAIKERDKAIEKERSKREKEKQKREKEEQKKLQQEEKKREKEAKEKAKQKEKEEKEQEQNHGSGDGRAAADHSHHEVSNGNDITTTHDIVLRQAADAIAAGNQHLKQADVDRGLLASSSNNNTNKKKAKKLRKFCMLPRKKSDGSRDSCWIDVYMEGMDEVGAHCGLFFPGPQYETLIGDVGMRIQGWVHEDASRRAILEG
ncbi:hypothetical protein PspLS_09475 [Pyricularia sp. CBS 133598]|nr:hypothetical protein PspLS_09475 [Pyricularia sp. CBS 133598]